MGAGFFPRFTPTSSFTPNMMLDTRGLNFDDVIRPSPTAAQNANFQFDKIVDNLKSSIQINTNLGSEHSSGQKSMNLDIELINDTYTPAPLTNGSNIFKFPTSTTKAGKRPGDFIQSPNSSFHPKKK